MERHPDRRLLKLGQGREEPPTGLVEQSGFVRLRQPQTR